MTAVVRQCFEYNGDISRCLEVIRPEFSACEKSNTPKGQKNNKRPQSLALWSSIFTQQTLQHLDNLQSVFQDQMHKTKLWAVTFM